MSNSRWSNRSSSKKDRHASEWRIDSNGFWREVFYVAVVALGSIPLIFNLNPDSEYAQLKHNDSVCEGSRHSQQPEYGFHIAINETIKPEKCSKGPCFDLVYDSEDLTSPAILTFLYGDPEQSGQNAAWLKFYHSAYHLYYALKEANSKNQHICNEMYLSKTRTKLQDLAISVYSGRGQSTTRTLMRNRIDSVQCCDELVGLSFQVANDIVKQLKKPKRGHDKNDYKQPAKGNGIADDGSQANRGAACEALLHHLYAQGIKDKAFREQLNSILMQYPNSLPSSVEKFIHGVDCNCRICRETLNQPGNAAKRNNSPAQFNDRSKLLIEERDQVPNANKNQVPSENGYQVPSENGYQIPYENNNQVPLENGSPAPIEDGNKETEDAGINDGCNGC